MWPYNDDEAGWLTPPKAEQSDRKPINDNDPARQLPVRVVPDRTPKPASE